MFHAAISARACCSLLADDGFEFSSLSRESAIPVVFAVDVVP